MQSLRRVNREVEGMREDEKSHLEVIAECRKGWQYQAALLSIPAEGRPQFLTCFVMLKKLRSSVAW